MAEAYHARFLLPAGSVVEYALPSERWTPDWLDLAEPEDLPAYRALILGVRGGRGYLPLAGQLHDAADAVGAAVLALHLPPDDEPDDDRVY